MSPYNRQKTCYTILKHTVCGIPYRQVSFVLAQCYTGHENNVLQYGARDRIRTGTTFVGRF